MRNSVLSTQNGYKTSDIAIHGEVVDVDPEKQPSEQEIGILLYLDASRYR